MNHYNFSPNMYFFVNFQFNEPVQNITAFKTISNMEPTGRNVSFFDGH